MMDNEGMKTSLSNYPSARYVTQPRDHFDSSDTKTWQQAYYVNDTFWVPGSDAPVFVCVGGEGPPIDGSAVQNSVHCNVAVEWLAENKALMFAVEHRYYGCHNMSACPFTPADKKPLQWLSSKQALSDLSGFHDHAVEAYNLKPSNKWVSWGGSYPGMMAGWFRLKYPNKIHASVASSAPVHAKLDMREYNDVAAAAYGLPSVGGSPACTAAIAAGHATIGVMMNTESGRAWLAHSFPQEVPSAAWLEKLANRKDFAGNGVVYFPSQGNDPASTAPGSNIEQICKVMANESRGTPLDRLAALAGHQRAHGIRRPRRLLKTGARAGNGSKPVSVSELDYWGYQTCNEFGFYQTCEVGSKCFYTQGLDTLEDNMAFCQTDYNISAAQVAANIAATNAFYGGLAPLGPGLEHNASRIYYPNGDVDPWHGLSILVQPASEVGVTVLMVSGASHHAWTHPTLPTDQASVIAARTTIKLQVALWLTED